MTFHLITIFPHIFDSYLNESILKRAQKNNLINIKVHNLRGWASDKHKTVDDAPFGGGPGLVMKIEPIYLALQAIKPQKNTKYPLRPPASPAKRGERSGASKIQNTKIILLSAKGKVWNQQLAKSHSKLNNIILICGRYEGVDERVKKFVDEEISIGNYILTGGEIGALTIIDSITRLLPGALGNADSAKFESHSTPGVLEYPQYTRPEIFKADNKFYRVPKILLSGNHKKIAAWRAKKSKHIFPRLSENCHSDPALDAGEESLKGGNS